MFRGELFINPIKPAKNTPKPPQNMSSQKTPPNSKKDIVVKHKLPANINAKYLGGVVNFIK